jgi:hypothetical protein
MTDNVDMGAPDRKQLAAACLGRGIDQLPDADWWPLATAACAAGLAGVLEVAIEQTGVTVPRDARAALHASATRTASHTRLLETCVTPVVRAFADAKIPVLVFKGAALRQSIYRDPRLRPMSDVDFMIRPVDLDRALAALRDLGCRQGAEVLQPDYFPTYYHEVEVFTYHDPPARIDLHVRPFRPLRYGQSVPPDAFWRHAKPLTLNGAPALVPCPEEMLIHLAVHAAVHGADRLVWLHDIYRFATMYMDRLDWDTLVARASAWGLTLPFRYALDRTEATFNLFVPARCRHALADEPVGVRDHLALWHAPRDATHPIGHLLVDLLCTRGVRYRGRYLKAVLLPDRGHLADLYPHRHLGWPACAHAVRAARSLVRALRNSSRSTV